MKVTLTHFEYILKTFEDYDHRKPLVERRRLNYRQLDNVVGIQQQAFAVYWALQGAKEGGIGIDIGCGEIIHPFCLGVDKYCGAHHPDYPSPTEANYHPHIVQRCDKPLPFTDNCFDFLISLHSLEHMNDTVWTLKEWIRIVKPGGILAIIFPDDAYGVARGDKDHKEFWSAKSFKEEVLPELEELVEVIEYDSFQNNFCLNVVLKKKYD